MAVPDRSLAEPRPSVRPWDPSRQAGDTLTWAGFLALGLIWGSSFLFIRVGLEEGVPLYTLVSLRATAGAVFLGVVLAAVRGGLPGSVEAWRRVTILAFLQIVLPFSLITWGQQYIPSGMAGVLNGLVPLYAVVLGSGVLRDERMTPSRLVGVLVGFGGVVLMGVPSVSAADVEEDAALALLGMAAVALAAFWYAMAAVYARRRVSGRELARARDGTLRPITPLETAFAQVLIGAIVMTVVAVAVERPTGGLYAFPTTAEAWFAMLWLGILGTGVAYVLFFRIIAAWGATRATLVTYVLPLVALALGFVFLGERPAPLELVGAALVIAGIVLVTRPVRRGAAAVPGSGP